MTEKTKYDKQIKRLKKQRTNFIYSRKSLWLEVLLGIVGIFPCYNLVEFLPKHLQISGIILYLIIIAILFILKYKKNDANIQPYKRTENFIGLYDAATLDCDDKLIIRTDEINFLKSKIKAMMDGDLPNRTICLVGESGCGKSTILHMMLNTMENEAEIVDCSADYSSLFTIIRKRFGERLNDVKANLERAEKPILFVFDQFERFFFLDDEKQKEFRQKYLTILSSKKVVSIFVLRNEFLAQFTYSINLFDITNNVRTNTGVLTYYMPHTGNDLPQFFYCDNSNVIAERIDQKYIESFDGRGKDIKIMCECAFSGLDKFTKIYDTFKSDKLIEQQIFLNILENDKYFINQQNFSLFLNKEELLTMYFDRQLCSTGNYADAMRIMYLFSKGRKSRKAFDVLEIRNALYNTNSSKIKDCINKLNHLQLIRKIQNKQESYEVIHDYIADKYVEYCEKEMKPEVKMTLDNYISNRDSEEFRNNINRTRERKKTIPHCANFFLLIVLFFTVIITPIYAFIENNHYLFIIMIPAIFSTYYGYSIYRQILRLTCKKFYGLILPIMAALEITCLIRYNFFGVYLGVATIVIGAFLLRISSTEKLVEVSRSFFRNFGWKVVLTGITITVLGLFLNHQHILAASLMMVIIIYAYIAQLNENYYFYCTGMLDLKNYHKIHSETGTD